MSDYDRDGNVERQQVQEIALNIARRLLKVLEAGRVAPNALVGEIDVAARQIADIQRDVERVMAAQYPGLALEMSVLTHILGSQQHALGLLERIETRIQPFTSALMPAQQPAPLASYTPPQPVNWGNPAGVTPITAPQQRTVQGYGMPAAGGAPPFPPGPMQRTPMPQPRHYEPQQQNARSPQQGQPRQQRPVANQQSPKPQPAPRWKPDFATLQLRITEPKYAASIATLTVIAGSLIGASLLVPGPTAKQTSQNYAPGQKLDGRLDTSDAEMAALPNTQQFATGSTNTEAMEQPYLVVLSTRPSTQELQKDFQGFNDAFPTLLGGRKARVDRVQGQDQKTWHRLSLIPPQSQADAKELCGKLRAAGLTGCWIRRVPLDQSR